MIQHPKSEYVSVPIAYHSGQERIFFGSKARTKIISKGRRFGLTKGFANYAIDRMTEGVSPVLWVDTVYANIDRYVERYFLPVLVRIPSKYWTWRAQKKELSIFSSKLDLR